MGDRPVPGDRLAFSLDLLAGAGSQQDRPLSACAHGHLVVRRNSHYAPAELSKDLRSLLRDLVADCREA